MYCTYPVRTPSLMPMSSQSTISPVCVQSVHHLFCQTSVRTLPPHGHVKSIHHLSCPCPVRMPPKPLCQYPIRIPPFLPLSTQRWNICSEDVINGILFCGVLYEWGIAWARAVKMCTDLLEMECRDGLLPVNGLYMCDRRWTYAVERGYC